LWPSFLLVLFLTFPLCLALGLDARQEGGRGFVVGVLGDEAALKGALEDRLAQPLGAAEVRLDGGLQRGDDGEAALDFFDDAVLLLDGWDGNL
jgi:hypothetical protein